MKRLNIFLDKSPLWQNFLLGWVIFSLLSFAMFYGFRFIGDNSQNILISVEACIEIGIILGIFFSLLFILSISLIRKSQKFWEYSKVVEELINNAETKEELGSIYKCEFQSLRDLAQGGPHLSELTRLYTIMQTKYQYTK
jgi:hypothetical protein